MKKLFRKFKCCVLMIALLMGVATGLGNKSYVEAEELPQIVECKLDKNSVKVGNNAIIHLKITGVNSDDYVEVDYTRGLNMNDLSSLKIAEDENVESAEGKYNQKTGCFDFEVNAKYAGYYEMYAVQIDTADYSYVIVDDNKCAHAEINDTVNWGFEYYFTNLSAGDFASTEDVIGNGNGEQFVPINTTYNGYTFSTDAKQNIYCFDSKGKKVINEFKCDGTYTYYFQADGTAMKDRLTYHPDGVNVIYFDGNGHEVFSDFHHVRKSIAGDVVDDYCFFDVYGHMYVDVLTYDKSGTLIYYANPYGRLEIGKWFQFSDYVKWADGTPADANKGKYGYANADGTLMTNQYTYDWMGRYCYVQGNGTMLD